MARAFGNFVRCKPVLLDPADTSARLNVCEIGPCLYFNTEFRTCSSCGCYVDYKAMLRTEKCPENKWPV